MWRMFWFMYQASIWKTVVCWILQNCQIRHLITLSPYSHKSIDPVRKVVNYHGIATAVVTDAVPGCELWLNKIFPLATNITSGFPSNKRLLLYWVRTACKVGRNIVCPTFLHFPSGKWWLMKDRPVQPTAQTAQDATATRWRELGGFCGSLTT